MNEGKETHEKELNIIRHLGSAVKTTIRHYCAPIPSSSGDVEKLELSCVTGGNAE